MVLKSLETPARVRCQALFPSLCYALTEAKHVNHIEIILWRRRLMAVPDLGRKVGPARSCRET